MRLLVIAPPDFAPLRTLEREAHGVELIVGTAVDEFRPFAAEADAVLLAPRFGHELRELWPSLQNVRWLHSLAAGVEFLPFDLLRNSEVTVTNSRGLYADALAEFALAAMLWFAKDLRRLHHNQQARLWQPYTVRRLEGATAGVIGYGGIGQAFGRRAEAMGMKVLPIRRRQETGDPSLEEVIAQSDYLILSLPLTDATRGLLSRDRIALMKKDAVVINIGRGATVDQDALREALATNTIRGAALDVFATEPLPADDPLWQLENVLISPHTADHTDDAHDRAMQFFLDNLRRFQAGDSLDNVVDKYEQY